MPARRPRRSRAEALQLVAEFESSGLSRAAFCRERKLSVNTLDRHRYKLRRPKEQSSAGRWVAVDLGGATQAAATGSGLVVTLASGRRIEIARGFDPATLHQLLAALERA